MAHGVSSLYPPVSSSSCNSFVSPELKKTAMDVLCPASSLIFSFSGTGVLPSILVIINDCEIPGTVYSHPAAAAAARKLLTGGYSEDTPCAICYKVSWPDEKIIMTTIKNLHNDMVSNSIAKTALILVGDFLGRKYNNSKLYDASFTTEYRK